MSALIIDLKNFDKLKNEWAEIFLKKKNKNIIQSYEWFKSIFLSVDKEKLENIFIIFWKDNKTNLIFPLEKIDTINNSFQNLPNLKYLYEDKKSYNNIFTVLDHILTLFQRIKVNIKILQIPHSKNIDFMDLICNDDIGVLEFKKFMDSSIRVEWDLMVFINVLEDSCLTNILKNFGDSNSITIEGDKYQILNVESYEKIWANLSKNAKKNIISAQNKLKKVKNVELISLREKNELICAFNQLIELEASGWKGRELTAVKNNPFQKLFLKNLIKEFGVENRCEIFMLKIDGKCIASLLCIIIDDTTYTLKFGYNEKYKFLSPGVLLINEYIKKICGDPNLKKINFMSKEKWTAKWKPAKICSTNIIIFNSTKKSKLINIALNTIKKSKIRINITIKFLNKINKILILIEKTKKQIKNSLNKTTQKLIKIFDYFFVPIQNIMFNIYYRKNLDKMNSMIESSIERGIKYFSFQNDLMFDVIFTFNVLINKTHEHRLEYFETKIFEYYKKYRDPHFRLFDKNYNPELDSIEKLYDIEESSLYPEEKPILKCLYADKLGLKSDYLRELKLICDNGGYGTTHIFLGCKILKTFSKIPEDLLDKVIKDSASAMISAQKYDRISDIFSERTLLLLWGGFQKSVRPSWIIRIIQGQMKNGGWYPFRTIYRKKSHQHPTCVALGALILYKYLYMNGRKNGRIKCDNDYGESIKFGSIVIQ